ncbi:MAG: hypoxanthine phosphoribosyltransferase [Bacteroidales bacterium]|nr:hypoxanthine phosphoribosyltransferase [Bacteroidales bacterium]
MKEIKILDKKFKLFIPNEKITDTVERLAKKMNRDLKGKRPLFICILNGSFIFAAELYKRISLLDSEISFVRLASYDGDSTTGKVRQLVGLNENIEGRTVVVLEDIVDSGTTLDHLCRMLHMMNPAEVFTASLLLKPDALKLQICPDYVGLEIPNDFIVGYGLDYNGLGRNLSDIYSVINE